MIKIENVEVSGIPTAIRGMRNSWDSWEKSDSGRCEDIICQDCSLLVKSCDEVKINDFVVGKNDLDLMKRLVKAGTDHRKFMRMINVTMDIVAPRYWWAEYDTYKVGTVRNSCSTMHTIHKKEFELDDFSHDHLLDVTAGEEFYTDFKHTVKVLNTARKKYLETNNKWYWWQIIQLLPSSYNQRATVQVNYEALCAMYHARKNHKLDEWREFCEWIETLPYSELITGKQ